MGNFCVITPQQDVTRANQVRILTQKKKQTLAAVQPAHDKTQPTAEFHNTVMIPAV